MQINYDKIEETIRKIEEDEIIRVIFSNKNKNGFKFKKTTLENKGNYYLESSYTEKQVFNKHIEPKNLLSFILEYSTFYKQINFFCTNCEYEIKTSKKDKIFVFKKATSIKQEQSTAHNRTKNYLINEGLAIPPLVDMGVFTKDFKVVSSMQNKFRQINRYLEIINDAVEKSNKKSFNIIDFGCGKSYLTFVIYYYFKFIKKLDVNIIGLDLKEEVIKNCNKTAQNYGYENIKFYVGDIKDYEPTLKVDIVLTLHACDIATDYALFNAIKWNAEMIFSVPCCQHEINQQFNSNDFNILNRYGIAKERISALLTDTVRCNLLKSQGYQVDLMEFIDFDATPKNLLIRATKTKIPLNIKKEMILEVENLKKEFNFEQTLHTLLKKNKMI